MKSTTHLLAVDWLTDQPSEWPILVFVAGVIVVIVVKALIEMSF